MALWKRVLVGWIMVMGVWMYAVNFYEGKAGKTGECTVGYVYDGDTVALECGEASQRTARVQGLDTPETKDPRCEAERALGKKATLRLRALVAGGQVSYRGLGHDKYGRQLIRLKVDGVDVADTLVREGLAVRYSGGARPDWCRKLRAG